MITFVSMTPEETRLWLEQSINSYATELSKARDLDHGEALDKAKETLQHLLPDHEATTGHSFSWIVQEEDRVGRIWYGPSPTDEGTLYIYDISVDEGHQGQGVGSAALDLIADIARAKKLSAIELSVFDTNPDARRLYERKGYVAVANHEGQLSMRFDLVETKST